MFSLNLDAGFVFTGSLFIMWAERPMVRSLLITGTVKLNKNYYSQYGVVVCTYQAQIIEGVTHKYNQINIYQIKISKILTKLTSFNLNRNSVIPSLQSGFKSGYSCIISDLLKITVDKLL